MAVVLPEGPWTFEEWVHLESESGERFELVDGGLLVTPPPTNFHQAVARRLFLQLHEQCPDHLEVVYEVALRLGRDGRVPDLAVVSRAAPIGPGSYGYEPQHLALAIEVVSPSSHTNDRLVKPAQYARAGIPMYWRLETEHGLELTVMSLAGDVYAETLRANAGTVDVGGWRVDLDALAPP